MDLCVLPCALLIAATVWRAPSLLSDWRHILRGGAYHADAHNWPLRHATARNAALVLLDACCLVFSIPLAGSWRVFTFWRHLHYRVLSVPEAASGETEPSAHESCPWEAHVIWERATFYHACKHAWLLLLTDVCLHSDFTVPRIA